MANKENEKILLAHGGGGQLTEELLRNHIFPKIQNKTLSKLGDSAELTVPSNELCFTTDSYVVKPLFFNGGDIGKLAACGTINDLSVAGAKPVALSLALIIEDGFEINLLEKILESIGQIARENNVDIVTGDTKTVERGAADKIFINTAGIGVKIPNTNLGIDKIEAGDKIIINGTVGDHGMTIISQREGIKFDSPLKSDCAALTDLTCKLLENVNGIKFMRDPTRGGLAATLNEIAKSSGLSVKIKENDIPVDKTVQAAAGMLGFDVLAIANEGKFITVVSPDSADEVLNISRKHPLGKEAMIIGEVVTSSNVPVVELVTRIGGKRIVQMPYGRELPRIC